MPECFRAGDVDHRYVIGEAGVQLLIVVDVDFEQVDAQPVERRGGARPESSLATEKCVPCHGGVPVLRGKELQALARDLGDGWQVVGDHHLEREFRFPDFAQALAFTNRVGALAEEEGHHPEIHLGWGHVRVEIWTHAINGLSRNDFILAAKIDRVM